ncbi:MAG: hypothetical protein ACC682_08280 [Gemmatimonadota bacterium]
MKNLLQEIHERSLWQVLGIYLAGSWVVLQVVDTLNSTLGIPEWVIRATFVLLAIGLPIVIATAFVQRGWGGQGEGAAAEPSAVSSRRRVLSWRNAILGGIGAFAVLGLGTAAWLGMRAAGIGPAGTLVARGVLDERDVILLADFENSTNDPTLADVVTEALRVDLSQSTAVRLADPGFVASALERMQRPEGSPLTEDLAHEIARREGVKALVTGDVARAGAGYVLTASLVASDGGEILLSGRESARDSTRLLDAIDALSKHIRERVGDPLALLAAAPPLAQVTTSNLAALRAYTQAARLPRADAQRRLALFAEAVALDTTFASAWNGLGIELSNYGVEPGRAMDARTRAFELRDRLTERERNAVASIYYLGVLNEPRQAVPFLESMIEADSTDAPAFNNLGEAYRNLGELETALDLYHRAVAVDTQTNADAGAIAIPLMNIAQVSATLGEVGGALSAADLLEVYAPGIWAPWHRSGAAAVSRDYEAAEREVGLARDQVTGSPFLLAQTTQWLAMTVGIQGRLVESVQLWSDAAGTAEQNASPVEALRNLVAAEVTAKRTRGDIDRAGIDAALEKYPLADMDPIVRPYLDIAEGYLLIGFPEEARAFLAEFEASTPTDFQHGLRHQKHRIVGEIARLEGRYDDAIKEFRQSASRPQELEPMVLLARGFDSAGRPDSALVHYRQFLGSSHWQSVIPHTQYLAAALERAAELEYEAGNLREAAAYLAEFVNLWADADVDLQPRVTAAQTRLQEIIDEIG